jgi:hypothetical protein
MSAQLERINSTVVKTGTAHGRPLAVEDGRRNPALFTSGDELYVIVMTKFSDGELLFEVSNAEGTEGWRCRTTEDECGLTYGEIVNLPGGKAPYIMRIVPLQGAYRLAIGPMAGMEITSLRALLPMEPADPLVALIKRMAIKIRSGGGCQGRDCLMGGLLGSLVGMRLS